MAQAANGRAAGAPAEGEVVTEGAVLLTGAAGVLRNSLMTQQLAGCGSNALPLLGSQGYLDIAAQT